MFGVLKIAFGEDKIAQAGRVPGERDIFLVNLVSGAADADVRAVAVENLHPVAVTAAAVAAAIVAAVPRSSSWRSVSHVNFTRPLLLIKLISLILTDSFQSASANRFRNQLNAVPVKTVSPTPWLE
jgi:hypothetical protein